MSCKGEKNQKTKTTSATISLSFQYPWSILILCCKVLLSSLYLLQVIISYSAFPTLLQYMQSCDPSKCLAKFYLNPNFLNPEEIANCHKLNPPKSISHSAVLPTLLQIQHNCIFYLPSKSISFKPVIFPTSILSPHRLDLVYLDYTHRKFLLFMLRDAKHVNNRAVGECIH